MYSLQLVRGIAAILVLLHHITSIIYKNSNYEYALGIFDYGSIGVDLFFILSGFLIFTLHYQEIGYSNKLGIFFKKRLIRIYPVYWVVTLALIPIYFIMPSFGVGYESDPGVILKSLFLIPQDHDPILGVGWSLVYEVFFYIMFGLFILLGKKPAAIILSAWMVASISLLNFEFGNYFFKFLFSPIIFEFLLGCLMAFLLLNVRFKQSLSIFFLGAVTFLGAVLLDEFVFDSLSREGIVRVLIYGISSFLIILGIILIERQGNFKSNRMMTYFGDASYSIYLVHIPVILFLNKVFDFLGLYGTLSYPIATSILALVTLGSGCIFHNLIEKPLLSFLRKKIIYKDKNKSNVPHAKAV